jgi:mono/diheme cytochrome c family protein
MKKVLIFVLVALLVAAGAWLWLRRQEGFSARARPSALEAAAAGLARRLAVPAAARSLTDSRPATAEDLREGMEHFADHCALCHANNGSGDTSLGRNMYPKPPDMRGPGTQSKSDGELYFIIQNGVRLTGMPGFGAPGRTDDTSTWNLVRFLRHLPRLTPEEEARMKALNPISPEEWKERQEAEDFLNGTAPSAPSRPHSHKEER